MALCSAGVRAEGSAASCQALASADFSQVQDALTQIVETKTVAAAADSVGYCHVSGYVAPNIGFALRLPVAPWNGKLIELGCSGKCGITDHIAMCGASLARGYACIVTDGGHRSTPADGKWAYNNFASLIDYSVRASHVTALAGKAIVQRFYGQAPQRSYFMGCSAGGTQGMQLAQKFPWDFDGIVAGAPALSWTDTHVSTLWNNRALVGQDGQAILVQRDLDVLHNAVVKKCDLNDGVEDGLIGDPRSCPFDPEELSCKPGVTTQCLTSKQIDAVKKVYGGAVTSTQKQLIQSSVLPGSERTWLDLFRGSDANPTATYDGVADSFRYQDFQPNPGPGWKPENFDFDRDYARLGITASMEPLNPDLRKFMAAGGKLLAYTGWADALEGVPRTVDYYETAERVVGGRAGTQESFRLFVVPGMNHCTGGPGAFAINYLSYLETWVEKGRAPDQLIASHPRPGIFVDPFGMNIPRDSSKIEFTRPVYPYPIETKYRGTGDPKSAASFGPLSR
jgi:feruloyl esterase